jgi:hypothetical protein
LFQRPPNGIAAPAANGAPSLAGAVKISSRGSRRRDLRSIPIDARRGLRARFAAKIAALSPIWQLPWLRLGRAPSATHFCHVGDIGLTLVLIRTI